MSSLRKELTRTLLRISRGATPRPSPAPLDPEDAGEKNYEGRRLGRYNIVKHLGAGGMGHVYLAFDTGMGRHVALKFLSPDLIAEPEMLKRLRKEGLTASSLNHPNILTIYEIGEIEGERYIATEYVEGATLRAAIDRRLVDVSAALDIATQIASALVAAHSAGIVHRDLKPGNIMIRDDGYVKVIDFGLAKRLRRSSRRGEQDLALTRVGTIVGTVHYMSPEQAAGGEVDGRSDLWSVGVILFELVTRHLPFEGNSETEILDNIRDRSVPQLPSTTTIPIALADVIRRSLMKNPAERFQSARELLGALGSIHRPAVHASPRPLRFAPQPRARNRVALGVGASLLLAALWFFVARNWIFQPNWFQIEKVRQVTFNGRVRLSCLSPDGKYLAYVAGDPDGMQTLYLTQLNTATEQVKIPARKETYYGVSFSPDNQIYAVSEGTDLIGKLYAVPLVGDAPEKPILVDIDGPVTFSPSGEQFAFVRYIPSVKDGHPLTENAVFVANRDGSSARKLASTVEAAIVHEVAWSPFDNRIAATYIGYSAGHSGQPTLHLIDVSGSSQTVALPDWRIVGQPWWNDRQSLIINATARSEWSEQYQLRQLDIRSGKARNITRDLAGYKSPSLSADCHSLAAVKTESRGSLWVSSPGDFSRGQTSLAEVSKYPSLAWTAPDRVIVDSLRGGFPNLWQVDVNQLTRTSLTSEAFAEENAVAVPRSKSIVLASNRSGQFKIWRFDPDINAFTQLTFGPNYDQSPHVSPDGQWIVYTSWYSSSSHLRRVPLAGGQSETLTDLPATDALFSPDGKQIACYLKAEQGWTVATLSTLHPDLSPRPIKDASMPIAWSPDGRSLDSVFTDQRGVSNIWDVPLDGSRPKRITSFEDQSIKKFAWSPAGDRLACLRVSFGSDVALFSRLN